MMNKGRVSTARVCRLCTHDETMALSSVGIRTTARGTHRIAPHDLLRRDQGTKERGTEGETIISQH